MLPPPSWRPLGSSPPILGRRSPPPQWEFSLTARTDADRGTNVHEGLRGHPAGLFGARSENRLERRLIGAQLLITLPDRGQEVDDRLRDRALEVAVAGA